MDLVGWGSCVSGGEILNYYIEDEKQKNVRICFALKRVGKTLDDTLN